MFKKEGVTTISFRFLEIKDDTDDEYSYFEKQYMDETYLSSGVSFIYSEELGMMSDFDYYPYGII